MHFEGSSYCDLLYTAPNLHDTSEPSCKLHSFTQSMKIDLIGSLASKGGHFSYRLHLGSVSQFADSFLEVDIGGFDLLGLHRSCSSDHQPKGTSRKTVMKTCKPIDTPTVGGPGKN